MKIFNIPIIIHPSTIFFFLFVACLGQAHILLMVFICVLLHELGHALAAKKVGITISDITLYPIGGILHLDTNTTKNMIDSEFFITICGPLVNAILTIIGILLCPIIDTLLFIQVNLTLFCFNLFIPVYPMDGGRILRSSLVFFFPLSKANYITKIVSHVTCVVVGIIAIYFNLFIIAIIMLVMFFSTSELQET